MARQTVPSATPIPPPSAPSVAPPPEPKLPVELAGSIEWVGVRKEGAGSGATVLRGRTEGGKWVEVKERASRGSLHVWFERLRIETVDIYRRIQAAR